MADAENVWFPKKSLCYLFHNAKILSGYARRDNADGVKGWYYRNKTVLGIDKKDIFY